VTDFLEGLGFGLILQISVGPVCVAVLHRGVSQGFRQAWAMVWGAALVDAGYILLSVAGVSALLQASSVRRAVGLTGTLVLIYFGLRYLVAPADLSRLERRDASLWRSFTFGVGLTLTNPLTILFWAGVLGAMLSARGLEHTGSMVYFAAGCVAATLLFLTGVALSGRLLERALTPRLAVWLNRVVGVLLIVFAVRLAAMLFVSR
jgi:threonine/homoserine/homoserine lactone efflux protein